MHVHSTYSQTNAPTLARNTGLWDLSSMLKEREVVRRPEWLKAFIVETAMQGKGLNKYYEWQHVDSRLAGMTTVLFAAIMDLELEEYRAQDSDRIQGVIAGFKAQADAARELCAQIPSGWKDLEIDSDSYREESPFPQVRKVLVEKIIEMWRDFPEKDTAHEAFLALKDLAAGSDRKIVIECLRSEKMPISQTRATRAFAEMEDSRAGFTPNLSDVARAVQRLWINALNPELVFTLARISTLPARSFTSQGTKKIVDYAQKVERIEAVAECFSRFRVQGSNYKIEQMSVAGLTITFARTISWSDSYFRQERKDRIVEREATKIQELLREWQNPDEEVTVAIKIYFQDGRDKTELMREIRSQ